MLNPIELGEKRKEFENRFGRIIHGTKRVKENGEEQQNWDIDRNNHNSYLKKTNQDFQFNPCRILFVGHNR